MGFKVMIFLVVFAGLLYLDQEEGLARRRALIGNAQACSERPRSLAFPLSGSMGDRAMTKAVLGIIGGSGLYDLPRHREHPPGRHLEAVGRAIGRPPRSANSAGTPSSSCRATGAATGFRRRDINYRANIDALKRSASPTSSRSRPSARFREELAPGKFVLVDQFIDRTFARAKSFFGPGCVAHVSMAHPVSPLLADRVAAAARAEGIACTAAAAPISSWRARSSRPSPNRGSTAPGAAT